MRYLPFVTVCRTETDVSLCTMVDRDKLHQGRAIVWVCEIRSWLHLVCCFWNSCVARHLATGIIVQILKKIHCLHRIRASQNVVSQRCACRCGPRIAFVTSWCRTKKLPCSTHAAAGCVLLSSHTPPPGLRCKFLVPWEQMACLWPILQLRMQSDADRCYIAVILLPRRVSPAAGYRVSFCWRNPPCRWTQPCQVVEFNYQFMSKVCYIFNMNGEWSSRHRGWCRMGHKTLMATAKLSPLTEHIHAFSCFQWWPQLEPSLEARESVDVPCFTTPGLLWDFNYVALLVWAWLPDDAEGSNLQHHLVVKLNGLPRNQVQTTYVAADCVVFPSRTANHVVVGRKKYWRAGKVGFLELKDNP